MITSTSNQQIKRLLRLQRNGRFRQEEGVFLVEGVRMAREIPGDSLERVYATEEWLERLPKEWLEAGLCETVSQSVSRSISDTQTPQGILAVVRQKTYRREAVLGKCPGTACVLLLERLQDPGNLGTIFRTAEGAGVSGILMSRDTVDVYNPKTVRATMGAIFRVPFHYEADLQEAVRWLKERGVCCYAARLDGTVFYEQDYTGACCFFIGNEGNGLSRALAKQADAGVRIPMAGRVESLNAATAAAVLTYEAARQRYIGRNRLE